MDRIATLHVVRERPGRQPLVLARMLADRWRLRGTPGLRFARVLGTGRGDDTGPSADLRRQAYFLVWDDAASAVGFLEEHSIARRWRRLDLERSVGLRLISGHGRWSGVDVLDMFDVLDDLPGHDGRGGCGAGSISGEIVVLTRARVRMRSWRAFRAMSRRTSSVARAQGCRWAIGVGEVPVGRLGTASCWRSAADIDRMRTAHAEHERAAARAAEWFAESLFARFEPVPLTTPHPDLSAWNRLIPGSGQTGW